MRRFSLSIAFAILTCGLSAQDRVTLTNGDVLTGTIKSMADGKLIITSPLVGDITVPMTSVSDMVTQAMVDLRSKTGDTNKRRRIAGIEGGNLRLEGESAEPMAIAELGMINP